MEQKTKCLRSGEARSGSALLLSTILLFVVLGLVVSLSYVTVMEQKMSQKTKSSVGSFFNADSGVEWALNQIANASNPDTTTIQSKFALASDGSKACPFGGCAVYFLKADGTVITQAEASSLFVSEIKAVRSVGTQTTGEATERAIEAAVAESSGGGSFYSFSSNNCPAGWSEVYSGTAYAPFADQAGIAGIGDIDCYQTAPPSGNKSLGSCKLCAKTSGGSGSFTIFLGNTGTAVCPAGGWTEAYSGKAWASYADKLSIPYSFSFGSTECFQGNTNPGNSRDYGSCKVCIGN